MTDVSQTELCELCDARGRMYALLARLWREEADADLLRRLCQLRLPADVDNPDVVEGLATLKASAADNSDQMLGALAREFTRLFLGSGQTAAAFPYESVYTSAGRLLMQDARDAVVKAYRAEGLERAGEFTEPEDHVAFELEFMAHLCQQTSAALRRSDDGSALTYFDKQQDFLSGHIGAWVQAFCADVLRLAELDFYKGIARVTGGFIAADARLVSVFPSKAGS